MKNKNNTKDSITIGDTTLKPLMADINFSYDNFNCKIKNFEKEIEEKTIKYCNKKGILTDESLKRNIELMNFRGEGVSIMYDNLNRRPILYIKFSELFICEMY